MELLDLLKRFELDMDEVEEKCRERNVSTREEIVEIAKELWLTE